MKNQSIAQVNVTQTSISMTNGVELKTKFKQTFKMSVNKYDSVGQTLARVNKELFFEIVEGKRSGNLKGLNLRFPFYLDIIIDGTTLMKSAEAGTWKTKGTCGLTENGQNRFAYRIAEQMKMNYAKKTGERMNGDHYTMETADEYRRVILNENTMDMVALFNDYETSK